MTPREIADLFADLELRLIQSLRRNLAAHKSQEKAEGGQNGVPEHWPAWQAEKLRSLNRFRQQNEKIAEEFTSRIDTETRAMLEEQFSEADGSEGAFFGVNADKVGALIDEMTATEADVQKAALRYMDDVYRQTILRADAALTAGGVTMQQAVDLAVKDFLRQGITCIRYKNGRRVNIATYAEMALRTSNTRAMLLGEAQKRERMGIDTVLVSQYGACSDTCLPWQGLVYIDDVWQPYHGDSNAAMGGSYGQSRNGRSYLLLSVAVKAGLFHPNCQHTVGTWIEGVSRRPEPMDKGKIETVNKLKAKQRRLELAVRRGKRLVAGTQDPAKRKEYKAQLRQDQKTLQEFLAAHDDVLRRDRWRERDDLQISGSEKRRGLSVPFTEQQNNSILEPKTVNGDVSEIDTEVKELGRLNTSLLEEAFGHLRTDEVVITPERAEHIRVRHPQDYELFRQYGKATVEQPDLLIRDLKNKGTVFAVKKLPDTNLNVILRLVLEEDAPQLKNSVMTFYRIREKNLKKLIAKNQLLYSLE